MGNSYKTRRNRNARLRLDAVRNGDEFAKLTFVQLRKDDGCINRFLRFFGFKSPQNVGEVTYKYNAELLEGYVEFLGKRNLVIGDYSIELYLKS